MKQRVRLHLGREKYPLSIIWKTFLSLWEALTLVELVVKNPSANARDLWGVGSIPGSGRSPGGGHGNPLQYSCLQNPKDRGSWRATAHRVAKSRTRLKQLSTQVHTCIKEELQLNFGCLWLFIPYLTCIIRKGECYSIQSRREGGNSR